LRPEHAAGGNARVQRIDAVGDRNAVSGVFGGTYACPVAMRNFRRFISNTVVKFIDLMFANIGLYLKLLLPEAF